jgi:hypothetical protein
MNPNVGGANWGFCLTGEKKADKKEDIKSLYTITVNTPNIAGAGASGAFFI